MAEEKPDHLTPSMRTMLETLYVMRLANLIPDRVRGQLRDRKGRWPGEVDYNVFAKSRNPALRRRQERHAEELRQKRRTRAVERLEGALEEMREETIEAQLERQQRRAESTAAKAQVVSLDDARARRER